MVELTKGTGWLGLNKEKKFSNTYNLKLKMVDRCIMFSWTDVYIDRFKEREGLTISLFGKEDDFELINFKESEC